MIEIENLFTNYPTKKYQPGEIIIHQGDEPSSVNVVLSGVIKVYDIDTNAEIKTIALDGKYTIFPLAWVFSYKEEAMYYYEAYTPCEICQVPKGEFFNQLSNDPALGIKIINLLVSSQIDSWRRIDGLTQLKAEDKIIYTLDHLSRHFGRPFEKDKVKILLPISQQELANYCGLTRETVSTALTSLKTKGYISSKGMDGFVIDIEKVNEIIE